MLGIHYDRSKKLNIRQISTAPLTTNNWNDFEVLFGDRGACGGCWCMYWRLNHSSFQNGKGEMNKQAFRKLLNKNEHPPGILMYYNKNAIGWCAVAPREEYITLKKSRILKPVDQQPVWSIVCFFIRKDFRRLGLTKFFLKHILRFCRNNGAKIVEGYPINLKGNDNYPAVFAYTGIASAFRDAGFKMVACRSPNRPIMRYTFR